MVRTGCALVTAVAILIASPVNAQMYDPRYPVCLHVYGQLEGERMDCIVKSVSQCAASASGLPASCIINPYFEPRSRSRHS